MSEFTPITTQEEFDSRLGDRLNRATEKAIKDTEAKYADYNDLKTQVAGIDDLKKSHAEALEKANNTIAELQKENSGYKRASIVRKATKKFGMDYDASSPFIQGNTEEEITASAEALSKIVGHSGGAPLRNPSAGENSIGNGIKKLAHQLSTN